MFKTPLVLENIPYHPQEMMVYKPLRYCNLKLDIIVLPGFITDGASVPKLLQNIYPPFSGRYIEAAVLHDALYMSESLSRLQADKLFLEAMETLGVSWWKRMTMYYAVRAAGWYVWRKHKPKDVSFAKDFISIIEKDNYENN